MAQTWQHRDKCLDDELLYLVHQFIALLLPVVVIVLYVIQDGRECPLVSRVSGVFTLVELKLALVLTVYRVVCQVHEHVAQVLLGWLLVRLGRETSHAFAEKVDLKWFNGEQKDIESTVKLKVIDQHWLLNVLLNDVVVIGVEVLVPICQEDALTLATSFRLYDVNRSVGSLLLKESVLEFSKF